MFRDRIDAGRQLAAALKAYKDKKDVIVIALPRGGVVVGAEVSWALGAPLDIVVPRKIGAPGNEEFAIGAIAETGEGIFNDAVIATYGISKDSIAEAVAKERAEAERRMRVYRGNRPPLDLHGKVVLLVDDGIATGLTMKAAVASARKRDAERIVVAVPVGAPDSIDELKKIVDTVVCLHAPEFFGAVGQFYEHFDQTTDEEVIEKLKLKNQNGK